MDLRVCQELLYRIVLWNGTKEASNSQSQKDVDVMATRNPLLLVCTNSKPLFHLHETSRCKPSAEYAQKRNTSRHLGIRLSETSTTR